MPHALRLPSLISLLCLLAWACVQTTDSRDDNMTDAATHAGDGSAPLDASDTADTQDSAAPPATTGELRWYRTCGDPVCGSAPAPDPEDACQLQLAGELCEAAGESCDPGEGCGVRLLCTDTAPQGGFGGCPRSRRRFKRDIRYVDADRRAALTRQLLDVRLTEYTYRDDPGAVRQLGFLIDDLEPSPAVRGDRVHLYGYLSMAVAALQEQASRMEQLEQELARLRDAPHQCNP